MPGEPPRPPICDPINPPTAAPDTVPPASFSPLPSLLHAVRVRADARAEIASADPRVVGLQLGLGDLFEPFGIDRADARAVHTVQLAVRLAAADAGVWACDTVYGTVADPDGYTREAETARRLGYIGKSCIHPTQVPLANSVFRPTDAEIADALRVVEASRGAERKGVGAYLVYGRMIDAPFVRRAESIIAAARRLGLTT